MSYTHRHFEGSVDVVSDPSNILKMTLNIFKVRNVNEYFFFKNGNKQYFWQLAILFLSDSRDTGKTNQFWTLYTEIIICQNGPRGYIMVCAIFQRVKDSSELIGL